jgi:hypothetical protein
VIAPITAADVARFLEDITTTQSGRSRRVYQKNPGPKDLEKAASVLTGILQTSTRRPTLRDRRSQQINELQRRIEIQKAALQIAESDHAEEVRFFRMMEPVVRNAPQLHDGYAEAQRKHEADTRARSNSIAADEGKLAVLQDKEAVERSRRGRINTAGPRYDTLAVIHFVLQDLVGDVPAVVEFDFACAVLLHAGEETLTKKVWDAARRRWLSP